MEFEEYVAVRGRALERFAYLLTGDLHAAQDLVQSALLASYVRWKRVSRVEHPDAYVRRIVATTFLDGKRRFSSREALRDPHGAEARAHTEAVTTPDHADRVADHDQLERALATVSGHQRAVLVLRHYEGYDDAAIAAVLGCSEATVRSHASRGLARLREHLATAVPTLIQETS